MRIPRHLSQDRSEAYAVIGVYARIVAHHRDRIDQTLRAISGVTPFDLEHPAKIGILIEADSLAEGRECLEREIRTIPGVLATWPVFSGQEPLDPPQPQSPHQSKESPE